MRKHPRHRRGGGGAGQAELESQVHSEAWEAWESCLCCVAHEKLKKDPPEEFTVTLFFYHVCQLGNILHNPKGRELRESNSPSVLLVNICSLGQCIALKL